MNRQKIANALLILVFFFLPWQTIFFYRVISLPEGVTVYGNLGVYAIELLIVFLFLLRGRPMIGFVFKNVLRAFYFFLAACFLSLGWSHFFSVSLGLVSHVVVAGMLFLILLDERTKPTQVIHTFIAGLIFPCVLGWFQYLTGWSPTATILGLAEKHVETSGIAVVATNTFRSLRAYGPFPHPNVFGGYLAFAIVLLGLKGRKGLKSLKSWQGWGQVFLIAFFSSTLILTFSRGAWLALTFSLVVILAQAFWYKKLVAHRAFPLLSVGLITILLAVGMLHTHIFARFNPALHVEAISIEERVGQYQAFPSVFKIDPIFGVGPGTYIFALEALSKNEPAWNYQPIHNTFLLLLAELGVVGFVAFGYALFEIARLIFKKRKTTGGIFAVAFLTEFMILALFDHYLFSLWPGIVLVATMLALLLRGLEDSNKTA